MTDSRPPRRPLRRSFREAHPVLKLSFGLCLCLGLLLIAEALSFVVLHLRFGGRPHDRLAQDVSGYRVFKQTSDFPFRALIAAEQGESLTSDALGLLSASEYSREKPQGTLRVIVTGGSALAGAGQTPGLGYEAVHAYPTGTYAWGRSIAGRLEARLTAALPGRRVEVISAGYNQKCLHQSLLHYLELLHRLEPDYVVSMDGYNDLALMVEEDPYLAWESRFQEPFLEVHERVHHDDSSYLRALIGGLVRTYLISSPTRVGPTRNPAGIGVGGPPSQTGAETDAEYWRREGERILAGVRRNWLGIARHFHAACAADGVRLMLVMQPILGRSENKALSEREQRLALVQPLGWRGQYFLAGVSGLLAELARERGGLYVDMGAELRSVGSEVEVYTDYCHLTPEGNELVARSMADAILADLQQRGR